MVIVWRVRGKIIRSVLCYIVHNNCAQCCAQTWTDLTVICIGFLSHWAHFTVLRFIFVYVLLYAWWDWSLSLGLLLQCFDTVGWVIWPVKPVPDMTYNVFGGTLNPTQPINLVGWQEGHPACKNWVVTYWRGYLSGARCKRFAYGPADAISTSSSLAPVKSWMVYLSGGGLPRLSWKKAVKRLW